VRRTLVGIAQPDDDGVRRTGDFGPGVRIWNLIGIDNYRRGFSIVDSVSCGQRLTFCEVDQQTARTDLVRICAEIREALESQQALTNGCAAHDGLVGAAPRILGAHYVSCPVRSGLHIGTPGAELRIIQKALGDVPLTGFFTSGEIAYRYLYGFSGVLTVFAQSADQ
jgi:small ligand-binding sensory domain FIST